MRRCERELTTPRRRPPSSPSVYLPQCGDAVRARVVAVQRVRYHDGAVAPGGAALLEKARDDAAAEARAHEHHGALRRGVDRRRLELLDVVRHGVGPGFKVCERDDAAEAREHLDDLLIRFAEEEGRSAAGARPLRVTEGGDGRIRLGGRVGGAFLAARHCLI